jgi:flagellum-specific peptidoglycan hydrolase FlgJ
MKTYPKTIDLMPALAMKRFYRKPKPQYTLAGTLVISNCFWLALAAILLATAHTSISSSAFIAKFYIQQKITWAAQHSSLQKALEERTMELAKLVALQTSQSPQDVLQLAKKLSIILNTSSGKNRAFLEEALPHAIRMQVQYGIPASAILSMSIYESGYGSSALAKNHHNYFGIKAFSNWKGPKANMPTTDSGVKTTADFRKYSSLAEGYEGYANFLKESGRYNKAFYANSGEEFVRRVLEAGYCPDANYLENIKAIMRRHHLQELDTLIAAGQTSLYQTAWKN